VYLCNLSHRNIRNKYDAYCLIIVLKEAKTDKLEGSYFLKISSKQADEFTNFGVTATFQNFIAKKLDEILER